MTKHTQGKWRWVNTPSAHALDYPPNTPDVEWDGTPFEVGFGSFDELRGDGVTVLCGVPCNDSTAEIGVYSAEHAALIAAAPQLLEALKAMLGEFPDRRLNVRKDYHKMVAVEAAKTAIALANLEVQS
jgi:hypothetical protein